MPIRITDVVFHNDITVAEADSTTTTFRKTTDKNKKDGPILLSLNMGGTCHETFGVQEDKYKPGMFNVTLTLHNEDHASLQRLQVDMQTQIDPDEKLQPRPIVPSKKPNNRGGFWPASICLQACKKLKIKKNTRASPVTVTPDTIFTLKGAKWKRAVFEITGIYFREGKYGLCKKLRFLELQTPDTDAPLVSSDDEEGEEEPVLKKIKL
jgi:hypothetical protein